MLVEFRDPETPLVPGDCDMKDCGKKARYSIGNIYLCQDCLILACEVGEIKDGLAVFRVPEYTEIL